MKRVLSALIAGFIALVGASEAAALTVTYDGETTLGEDLTISISTDDRNLGRNQPAYLSLFEMTVVIGNQVYSINQSIFSAYERGNGAWARLDDQLVSGVFSGNNLTFIAEEGTWSNYIPGRSGMLSTLTLQFAESFQGPITLDTVFAYLRTTTLVGAFGSAGDVEFLMEQINKAPDPTPVPIPPAGVLFLSGIALLARKRPWWS